MDLCGKKILFIGIGFYDYDALIIAKLEAAGANVTYICQEHQNRFVNQLTKISFCRGIESRYSAKYLSGLVSNESGYDEVFVIKGSRLSPEYMNTLRLNNPMALFKLYQWDSIKRFEGDKRIFDFFDFVYSFDRIDCKNNSFTFVPLFFRQKITRKSNYKYDLSFVGWLHFNRLRLLMNMSVELAKAQRTYKFYLFTGIKSWFVLNIVKGIKFIHRKTLPYSEYLQTLNDSDAVLDFHHPDQDGLTMRTIEALGANRKIITTNADVKNYDFYNENNVLVLEGESDVADIVEFVSKGYIEVPDNILDGYSLDSWLARIFN
ncbi:MAG: hypothetical protein RPR97_07610 [Colwellia sp.]